MLADAHLQTILDATGASSVSHVEPIQSLWSGYGEIVRASLVGGIAETIVAKWVDPPSVRHHPRGWNSDNSHRRKLRSYQVESCWYAQFSDRTTEACRVAKCYATRSHGDQHLFVLEDLDAAGFNVRYGSVSVDGVRSGLTWLANFHAAFLDCPPLGLWPVGTYWHLETRPDELAKINDGDPLKKLAYSIDQALSSCPIQTIVHGDAKSANFCYSPAGDRVAVVDFQYVGGGCGMKDVAYYLGSCLDEDQCNRDGEMYLDFYFAKLGEALKTRTDLKGASERVESVWRPLYPVAWADFHRFLLGWCPGHQKLHAYTKRNTEQTIAMLR